MSCSCRCLLLRLGLVLGLGLLQRWESNLFARATLYRIPDSNLLVHIPGKQTYPRLDIVVELEDDVVGAGNLAAGVRNLVLRLLVLELEDTTN